MSRSRGRTVIPAPVSGTGQALSRNPERFVAGKVVYPRHFWIPACAGMTVGARNDPLTLNSYGGPMEVGKYGRYWRVMRPDG